MNKVIYTYGQARNRLDFVRGHKESEPSEHESAARPGCFLWCSKCIELHDFDYILKSFFLKKAFEMLYS